jgi:hypothetical protein
LIKIVAVVGCERRGKLPRRECAPPFEFGMGFGLFDVAAQHCQVSELPGPVARRDASHVGHGLIVQGLEQPGVTLLTGDQDEVRGLGPQPAPQDMRLSVFPIRDSLWRKRRRSTIGIGEGYREQVHRPFTTAFIVRYRCTHGSRTAVLSVQTADQHDRRRRTAAGSHRDAIDARSAARKTDIERFGGTDRHRCHGCHGCERNQQSLRDRSDYHDGILTPPR